MLFRSIILILCSLIAFVLMACKNANVAPGGTTLFLTAQPEQISVNGSSELTVIGTVDGQPLEDGTVIKFSVVTEAGSISPSSAATKGGIATATFRAANFPAEVKISAASGPATAEATITVVDNRGRQKITLSADPPNLPPEGGSTHLTALVTDESDEPVSGARIVFSTDAGTLHSRGSAQQTDSNGIASDVLTTDKTADVTAKLLSGTADPALLLVPVGSITITCGFTFSPTNPSVGTAVTFQDASTDPAQRIRSYLWDFGDGFSDQGPTVQHTYQASGTFSVAHVVVDLSGTSNVCVPQSITVTGGP